MKSLNPWITRTIVGALVLGIAGAPELLAQSTTQPAQQTQSNQTPQTNQTVVPDPSKGPLQPATPSQPDLPSAPSATTGPQTQILAPTAQPQQKQPEAPLGAAAAEGTRTSGGLASKPAGTAIAPAKQRQVRSMLIKIGAIGAGAAALGIVYGLSRGTSSTPPGATNTLGH